MKNYKYIILGVAALLTGCKDSAFFKTESPSAMDVTVFTIPSQTEEVIAGVYQLMGEQNSYRTRLSGPWVNPGNDCEVYQSKAYNYSIYTMTTAGNSDITSVGKHPWVYLTQAIERANVAIAGIEQYSDTTKTEFRYLYGEALTLRAWLHYEMTKLWGDVPGMFAPIDVTDDASIYPSKMDRSAVYEHLRSDLRHAAILMPNAAECPGNAKNTVERCNRQFALGLLARVDLVYAGKGLRPDRIERGSGYQANQFNCADAAKRVELLNEAMWACDEVMKADGGVAISDASKLKKNFEDVFKTICAGKVDYNATETLFEIPFANGVRGQYLNRMGAYVNKTAFGKLIHSTSKSKSNAKMVATTKLLFSFDPADKRRWVTINPFEWGYDNKKSGDIAGTTKSILYQSPEKINKMYLAKFRMEWLGYDMGGDDDGLNVPIMRYSDILLMYAEAAIGSVSEVKPTYVGSVTPLEAFNAVRKRAGVATKAAYTMEDIQNERMWEFTGEFIRQYDLMRWGIFSQSLVDAQADFAHFCHITDSKVDFTGTPYEGKLAQNMFLRYKKVNDMTVDGSDAYVISEIYGLTFGENTQPADYVDADDTGGWIKVDPYTSDGAATIDLSDSGTRIYSKTLDQATLEARQYWPLFDVITSANHNLWNDYLYQ